MDIFSIVFLWVAAQCSSDASQARDFGVAKSATRRSARPDPSLRKKTLVQDDK
jgi:hypothetical protein